ncbi:GNAT family N-acetyltransferase [Pseudoalteromonas sp. MMG012]|uniref:GNAT family N-acetyltransferase n=1 Tax=Pseudoalteromonas sp. MMG012 TaxID=2822686 RepID=UPI001B3A6BF4|nr:GNAT family protein [Pseudoalteromonas sp. MMG012]MBQ4850442.1 GNAT family N-acetyltransferase [Pseudoalteromonas sp. MMG012]
MLTPTTLSSHKITLEPIAQKHLKQMLIAGQDASIWRWVPTNYCRSPSTLQTWLDDNAKFNPQAQLTFAIIDIDTHTVVGTTRLFRLDSHNLSAEVGHTFIGVPWQRSYVNTHAKHLILTYAFEQLNLVRVTICTNEKNDKSRSAILRLGAKLEGIAYKNRLSPDGTFRNSAIHSITDDTWPEVKRFLESRL